jgi:hypothetical protein
MALNSNALATVAQLQAYLKEATTDASGSAVVSPNSAVYEMLINSVSQTFENYCNRKFALTEYTEYHDGDGGTDLFLYNYPVVIGGTTSAVFKLWIDLNSTSFGSSVFPDSSLLDQTNYILYPEIGKISMPLYYFIKWWRPVKVQYSAGYATIPSDLQWACLIQCAELWKKLNSGTDGIQSLNFAHGNIVMAPELGLPAKVKMTLDQYWRPNTSGI